MGCFLAKNQGPRAGAFARSDEGRLISQGFVERAEFDALLSELPSQVLRDVAAFAYCTGMRKGEILSLTWDGYNHETKTIRLQAARAKTGRGRVLRCGQSPELVAVLERRLAERRLDSPLIFHNGHGRHVGNFSTSWGRALGRAKVAFAFHDLRRTAVRDMSRAGVPKTSRAPRKGGDASGLS